MNAFTIERVDDAGAAGLIAELTDVLIDTVAGGASVGFMWPLSEEKARAFWERVAGLAGEGDRMLFVARDSGGVCGTVQVLLAFPENQPHRGEIAKLQVHRRARRRGIAEALMRAAEAAALAAGKTLLVLDTASEDAERLYRRLGWTECGVVPDYALLPDGAPCATTFFWKRLASLDVAGAGAPALDKR